MKSSFSYSHLQEPTLPSGITHVESIAPITMTPEQLPWLDKSVELAAVECTTDNGQLFDLVSAIGTNRRLTEAASALTAHQSNCCNNTFYSRLSGFLDAGYYSPHIEKLDSTAGALAFFAVRKEHKLRIYFGLEHEDPTDVPLIVRVGVCNKPEQQLVLGTLTRLKDRANRIRTRRGTR